MGWLWEAYELRYRGGFRISIPLWDDCETPLLGIEVDVGSPFQFHYGMIVSYQPHTRVARPTAISIPLWDDCETTKKDILTTVLRFQFHYGMIVRVISLPILILANGISIPLWDDCEYSVLPSSGSICKFQFHYGMIVSPITAMLQSSFSNFNSTMGWLWDIALNPLLTSNVDFNSTMGWLWALIPTVKLSA